MKKGINRRQVNYNLLRVPSSELVSTFLYHRLSSNFLPAVEMLEIKKTKPTFVISSEFKSWYDNFELSFFDFQLFYQQNAGMKLEESRW